MNGLSLFSNVGIAEAYLADIGIDIVLANEIDKQRARFYSEVYPRTEVICGDITNEVTRDIVVDKAIQKKVDFVIATPPCQGMSEAGKRLEFDARNRLIFYAIDVIKRVSPKFVLLENVPKQLTTKIDYNGEIIFIPEYIRRELGNQYIFNDETLVMAKDYGVPQLRQRNIFLLVRKDLGFQWTFPEKQKEITLQEAIGELPSLDPFLREGEQLTLELFPNYYKKINAGMLVSKWHYPPTHSYRQVQWMMHTPTGKSAIYNDVLDRKSVV